MNEQQLYTIRQIADHIGKPTWRIRYVILNHGPIKPALLAGNTQLFDARAIRKIKNEIKAIEAAKQAAVVA